jgi:hypothetical protein
MKVYARCSHLRIEGKVVGLDLAVEQRIQLRRCEYLQNFTDLSALQTDMYVSIRDDDDDVCI